MAPSKTQKARRAEFARYKEDVKREGKPFFPYAMLHDTIMSLVVVVVIIALACDLVLLGRRGQKNSTGSSGRGTRRRRMAASDELHPATGLVLLLPLLPAADRQWPETVVLGTVGIPTILLILLLGLPFYDRSRERRPLRRPVAMVPRSSSSSRWAC